MARIYKKCVNIFAEEIYPIKTKILSRSDDEFRISSRCRISTSIHNIFITPIFSKHQYASMVKTDEAGTVFILQITEYLSSH